MVDTLTGPASLPSGHGTAVNASPELACDRRASWTLAAGRRAGTARNRLLQSSFRW
jgi:hypothetical protein